jgi:hypothetical protein
MHTKFWRGYFLKISTRKPKSDIKRLYVLVAVDNKRNFCCGFDVA